MVRTTQVEVKHLLPAWHAFREATDIAPIRSKAHYRRMCNTLKALLAEAALDERHPLIPLVDIVGDLIADYESKDVSTPEATGVQALKFLMDQHDVKQGVLQEVGSQGVVSEILAGKRELNLRQVRALAQRFGVSVATFV
jgi:HTH-type transcriptional regulator / antitoxin HigA